MYKMHCKKYIELKVYIVKVLRDLQFQDHSQAKDKILLVDPEQSSRNCGFRYSIVPQKCSEKNIKI